MRRINTAMFLLVVGLVLFAPLQAGAKSGDQFTVFDPPGSKVTYATSINPAGTVTGYYFDAANTYHSYLRDAKGQITVFDPPGSSNSFANSINPAGSIAGEYQDAYYAMRGFVRDADGT